MKTLLTVLFFGFFAQLAYSSVTTAIVDDEDWDDPATWDNGAPGCFDTIIIPANIQVNITSTVDLEACPDSILVIVYGRIEFQNGKKLKLPCDSDVMVMTGGSVGVGSGGGSSTYIEMCGTQYWNASSGDLTGPESLCDGGCPGSMLPIELLYFNAVLNDGEVDLTWVTKTEIDNDYFTVERSQDGSSWTEILEVDGAGNSSYEIEYFQVDRDPFFGNSYYRLKQTDFNGDYTYSPIVNIYQGGEDELILYPNPVMSGNDLALDFNHLVIVFPDIQDNDFLVQIFTIDGKLMYSTTVDLTKTTQLFVPIGAEYSSGMYTVSTEVQQSKFIVR